jgi:hypothetical protein
MTPAKSCRYCGRDFSPQDMRIIRKIIVEDPDRSRFQISKIVCKTLGWFKPDGGLKDMSCRVALLRMQDDGLIQLPPPRNSGRKGKPCCIAFTTRTLPEQPVINPVHHLPPLRLIRVISKDQSRLWNEYIHRYHYLGFTPLPGAQIRYFVCSDEQTLALLGFSAAAWKTAPRDEFIGWSPQQRQRSLHRIVNNSRFLILPWINSKNLASKILSTTTRQLSQDWMKIYNYSPLLLETFVQSDKFAGTCYKAANWVRIGITKGRGKLDRNRLYAIPKKDIWVYPLRKNFKEQLLI